MADLSAFKITQRWPAQHPDRIQLYSLPTPNGVKVTVLLEELLAAGDRARDVNQFQNGISLPYAQIDAL